MTHLWETSQIMSIKAGKKKKNKPLFSSQETSRPGPPVNNYREANTSPPEADDVQSLSHVTLRNPMD